MDKWEIVANNLDRVIVPGGWIYNHHSGVGESLCFVPSVSEGARDNQAKDLLAGGVITEVYCWTCKKKHFLPQMRCRACGNYGLQNKPPNSKLDDSQGDNRP